MCNIKVYFTLVLSTYSSNKVNDAMFFGYNKILYYEYHAVYLFGITTLRLLRNLV